MLGETELDRPFEQPTGGHMLGCLAKTLLVAVFGMLGVILFDVLAQVLR